MSSPWRQEEVNDEHLTPTAETFTELKEIIVKSEEEIDGERRLLDFNRLPQIIVHQIDPQHHVEKEEAPVDLQLWPQQRNSKAGQEEIDPLQIKEEQKELEHLQIKEEEDELCISQDEAQIVLKQETETFMVTSNYEGKYLIEPEQNWNQGISQDTPEADQDGSSEEDSGSETDEEQIQNKRCQHNDSVDDSEQKITDEDILRFIQTRTRLDFLFTGKRRKVQGAWQASTSTSLSAPYISTDLSATSNSTAPSTSTGLSAATRTRKRRGDSLARMIRQQCERDNAYTQKIIEQNEKIIKLLEDSTHKIIDQNEKNKTGGHSEAK
ncbi:eukaryotic translation initiation factor 3 subunit A isoform X2 [Fundulus heteroclitus]|uniref:eukaryotic translation initiation factor 3 subunit A isoform X2 n=2 Tax=Fundulus heteroclitus TaxID=8078 RepID=UPI00165A6992|nr:eukaryotic translation initiation factor 3 subunit A isoform X2 [Fundulus heteroclitus]